MGAICAALLAACAANAPPPPPVAPAPRVQRPPRAPSAFEECVGEAEDASAFARLASEDGALAEAERDLAGSVQTLRALAFYSAAREIALRASVKYLEALNQIAVRTRRTSCYDVMAEATPRLFERHCHGHEDEAACGILASVVCDIERLGAPGSDYRAYAEAQMALWRRFGEPRVRRGLGPWCTMDEIVYNAMRAYRAAHDDGGAQEAAAILHAGWPGMPRRFRQ